MRPTQDRLVAKPIKPESVTAGGILIPNPEQRPDEAVHAHVIAIGPKVEGVKVGERVILGRYYQEVKVHGEDLVVIKEEHVFAVVEDAEGR